MIAMVQSMERMSVGGSPTPFDASREYLHQQELYGLEGRPLGGAATVDGSHRSGQQALPAAVAGEEERHPGPQWALLRFEQPITAPQDSLVIGAKLDAGAHGDSCRLAFYGRLLLLVDQNRPEELSKLRVYKVDRVMLLMRSHPQCSCGEALTSDC